MYIQTAQRFRPVSPWPYKPEWWLPASEPLQERILLAALAAMAAFQ
jgi:hypothetical protein